MLIIALYVNHFVSVLMDVMVLNILGQVARCGLVRLFICKTVGITLLLNPVSVTGRQLNTT